MAIGDESFSGWTGLKVEKDVAALTLPGEAEFRYPDGPRGFFNHGFRAETDSAADWHELWGVRVDVKLPEQIHETDLTFTIAPAGTLSRPVSSTVRISGAGWRTVSLPWSAFAFDQAGTAFLRRVKTFTISARPIDATQSGEITLRSPRVVSAAAVALSAAVRGKSAEREQLAEYAIDVTNASDETESVALSPVHYGWETMDATIDPPDVRLAAGESEDKSR